jgi:hypothetical protein
MSRLGPVYIALALLVVAPACGRPVEVEVSSIRCVSDCQCMGYVCDFGTGFCRALIRPGQNVNTCACVGGTQRASDDCCILPDGGVAGQLSPVCTPGGSPDGGQACIRDADCPNGQNCDTSLGTCLAAP